VLCAFLIYCAAWQDGTLALDVPQEAFNGHCQLSSQDFEERIVRSHVDALAMLQESLEEPVDIPQASLPLCLLTSEQKKVQSRSSGGHVHCPARENVLALLLARYRSVRYASAMANQLMRMAAPRSGAEKTPSSPSIPALLIGVLYFTIRLVYQSSPLRPL
jgi:hypothetical protein